MSFIQEALTYGSDVVQYMINAVSACEVNYHQAIWIFGLGITDNTTNNEMVEAFYKENPRLINNPSVESVIEFVYLDRFKDETYKIEYNNEYWDELAALKNKLVEFYTKNVCESNGRDKFYEIHDRFFQMCLQLKRFRLVIQPECHVITNVHPVSKIPYLSVRGFWLSDKDKKVKLFTKSLGREDSYEGGKKDSEMLKEAARIVQIMAFAKYKELYN